MTLFLTFYRVCCHAYQQNNNVLVSDKATINAKPQLEIFADDVKCSHGATIGQLDEDALFYLRSRGLSLAAAEHLLIEAFIQDVWAKITFEPIKVEVAKMAETCLREVCYE